MTVGELKQALRRVPDNVPVTALKDGVHSERTDVWMAHYDQNVEEDGQVTETFTINC